MHRNAANRLPGLLLLALAMSVTGCATTLPPPSNSCPVPPPAPALTEAPPSVDYSISVQQLLKTWRARLSAMQTMP